MKRVDQYFFKRSSLVDMLRCMYVLPFFLNLCLFSTKLDKKPGFPAGEFVGRASFPNFGCDLSIFFCEGLAKLVQGPFRGFSKQLKQ